MSLASELKVNENKNGRRTMSTDIILSVRLRLAYPILDTYMFRPKVGFLDLVPMLDCNSHLGRLRSLLLRVE